MNPVLLQILQWGIPIGVANMAPVFIRGTMPLDFGKEWRGNRIFGKTKTIEGLFGGVAIGTLAGFLLGNYQLGFMVSLGALAGDLAKSFFKRRLGVESGKPWPPFDQIDFTIGGILFGFIVEKLPLKSMIILLIALPLLHPVANYLGYVLKIKKNKW